MRQTMVILYFDFVGQKITIEEKWGSDTGVPNPVWHKRAAQKCIAHYTQIIDQEETDKLISDEQRAEFVELCEKYYVEHWNDSNMVGSWYETPLEKFVDEITEELREEIDFAQQNMRSVAGLAVTVDASEYVEKIHFMDSGLTAYSSDKDCEHIAEEIEAEALRENGWALDGTENLAIYWRDKLREEIQDRVVFVVTHGAERSEHCDLEIALAAAYLTASEIAENRDIDESELVEWGDDMQTGWGVCPDGNDGAYWPQIHCELDGKRIDRLPWEERGTK